MKAENVLIAGSYSGQNKGDVAILKSILLGLAGVNPNARMTVQSKNPELLSRVLSNSQIVIRRSVTSYIGFATPMLVLRSDKIIIGGGGLFFDRKVFNPFYNHTINIFLLVIFCKMFRRPYSLAFVGSNRLKSPLVVSMTRYIVEGASKVVVRDIETKKLFQQLVRKKDITVSCDPVFSLPFCTDKTTKKRYVVLNLHNKSFQNVSHCKNECIRTIIAAIKSFFSEKNYAIVLYSNNPSKDLFRKIIEEDPELSLPEKEMTTLEEISLFLKEAEFVLATQLHVAIFSLLCQTPVLPYSYDEKLDYQLNYVGYVHRLKEEELFDAKKISIKIDRVLKSGKFILPEDKKHEIHHSFKLLAG